MSSVKGYLRRKSTKDAAKIIALTAFIFFILVMAFEGFVEFYGRTAPGKEETRWITHQPVEIVALNGFVATDGQFFLGSGTIDQSPGYEYAREFDQGTRTFLVSESDYREIYVKEANGVTPNYVVKELQYREIRHKWRTIFSSSTVLVSKWETYRGWDYKAIWIFTVPRGTVYLAGKLQEQAQ